MHGALVSNTVKILSNKTPTNTREYFFHRFKYLRGRSCRRTWRITKANVFVFPIAYVYEADHTANTVV